MIGRRPRLVLVPALAVALTGCGIDWNAQYDEDGNRIEPEPDYVTICQDASGNRVEDDRCPTGPTDDGPDSLGFVWFYMATTGGVNAPPVGHRVDPRSGSYRTPATPPGGKAPVVARGGGKVPSSGGVVQRGGLGVSGAKAGGGGS